MKKIVGVIRPITVTQNLFVYNDEECLESLTINLDDIPKVITSLASNYEVNDILLVGSKKFSEGIKNNIQKEYNKYNSNILNIKLTDN